MKVETSAEHFTRCAGYALVLPVYRDGVLPSVTAEAAGATGLDFEAIASRYKVRKPGDQCWVPAGGSLGCPDVLLVCVGDHEAAGVAAEDLRAAALRCARHMDRAVVVCLLDHVKTPGSDATRVVVEAMVIGAYSFDRYRTTSDAAREGVQRLIFPGADERAAHVGSVVGEATNFGRDLTNTPAADLTPEAFAGICENKAGDLGIAYRNLDIARLREGGFGGIVGVGAGSTNPPVLVCLESGDISEPATALVGKGITFDTGGLAVKTLSAMLNMKCDMGGAAAILAALTAARSLGVRSHLRGYLACAENAVGPNSQRPGDILRHRGGRTCEIVSPDAEGRLVLADAISYAREAAPARIIDIATLTGDTGLGPQVWGILGTSQQLIDSLLLAGRNSGDPGWQLPLWQGYRKDIRSQIADIRNHQLGMVWRHQAIWAALYLSEFVMDTAWAHLDIAATAFRDEADQSWAAGATGSGIRALIEFLLTDSGAVPGA
jgi:leucyl aminopeptidase